jgi:ABC-type nitrate/sulfonate/bicarbonate transport system substrate-binding protein
MYAPLYLGFKQGFFAQEGLEVEVLSMRTDLAIAALGTSEIDFIAHGGAALRAAAQGFPLKLVFALDHKAPFWLVSQPTIRNVQMLKGKKIGVSFPGDTPHLVLKRYLRRQGIDPERDVSYVGGQFSPTAMQSLLGKALDAAVLAPPFNVLALENGLRSVVFLGAAVPDATTANGIVTSDRKIKQRPDQVQRMIGASLRSLLFYREKKEVAVNFLATEFALSRSVAAKVYNDSLDILTPQGEISREKVRNILDLIEETKLQKSLTLKPDAIMDFSFLRKAQAELNR